VVIHTNGIHRVNVDFCNCEHRISHRQQLLRSEWFPATVHHPQTCCTVRVLELFHIITLAGKLNGHDFYNSLERLTDNTGLDVPKVFPSLAFSRHSFSTNTSFQSRYKGVMRMIRQFRHSKMMKRAGRGNLENGVNLTKRGDLTITCPACPIPGINLPEGWDKVDPALRYGSTFVVMHQILIYLVDSCTFSSLPWMPIFASKIVCVQLKRQTPASILALHIL
jgi:hypothetical protein